MSKVLGLSFFYHDSAAALVLDGKVVAAGAEERFSRKKHSNEFPKRAIEYCIEAGGLNSINDLDAIVFYEKPILKLFRIVETMVDYWPKGFSTFIQKLPSFLSSKVNIEGVIREHIPGYHGEILFSGHHLSHAASAFYCSPFEHAAILTVDGVGEWETTTIGRGNGNEITGDYAIHFPHSIGLLYSALTGFLGFEVNDGEWKVMGLAPYGKPTYVRQFRKLVTQKEDGSYQLNLKYFAHQYSSKWTCNVKRWEDLLGIKRREPESRIEQIHEDLAASGQIVVEELILNLARQAKRLYQEDNLVVAGGVGLNAVANWKIEKEGIFKQVWIQPAAGDDGGAIGAALLASLIYFEDSRKSQMDTVYLGPSFTEEEISSFLSRRNISYERLNDQELINRTADYIAQNRVVGWFQGAMEFGPRSLGSRSILANPTSNKMKELVNEKIKFREYFRPFAPTVLAESVHEYFDVPKGTNMPFMVKVPSVRRGQEIRIPAVTHEDGTSRIQTVHKKDNPRFYQLLEALQDKIGVPIVLNTSFNVRGEPIVCTPEDAYRCFMNTGLDALVLGNCFLTKSVILASFQNKQETNQRNSRRNKAEQPEGNVVLLESELSGPGEIIETVSHFYQELPFNHYSNSIDTAAKLYRKNPIKEYPYLNRYLKNLKEGSVLDVGCGSGWFVNSCAHYYKIDVTGVDANPMALKQAKSVARLFALPHKVSFVQSNLFDFNPGKQFDLVNSLGVFHHTNDCHGAIRKAMQWVKPGGYFHLGLYHLYGRLPFLEHFTQMRASGSTDDKLYTEFARLNPNITDQTHMNSWFRDQVLHPHETQHTYEEIAPLVLERGFEIEATSIDRYKPFPSIKRIAKLEKKLANDSKAALKSGRYYPGFFTIWARKAK